MKYKRPKGTQDRFNLTALATEYIVEQLVKITRKYGYKPIMIPTFEMAELYQRQMPTSDVVTKELYEFFDKKQRHLALRPEFTAGVVRAIVENKHLDQMPLRLFYYGNVFRYERPQANRYREFFQFGCELFGDNSPLAEYEIIQMCQEYLTTFKIKNFDLYINDIGDADSRKRWIDALREYFQKYAHKLTPLSRQRIQTNPLRILDDKIDGEQNFVKNSPSITEFLSQEEIKFFNQIKDLLIAAKIPFRVNPKLVRGLDYYTNFVFEFIERSDKTQNTLIAGGRYNSLVKEIGDTNLPAIGFSVGVDRLVTAYLQDKKNVQQIENQSKVSLVIGLSSWNKNQQDLIKLAKWFRDQEIRVITTSCEDFKKNINLTKNLGLHYYLECPRVDDLLKVRFTIYDVVDRKKIERLEKEELLKLINNLV